MSDSDSDLSDFEQLKRYYANVIKNRVACQYCDGSCRYNTDFVLGNKYNERYLEIDIQNTIYDFKARKLDQHSFSTLRDDIDEIDKYFDKFGSKHADTVSAQLQVARYYIGTLAKQKNLRQRMRDFLFVFQQ
jgi:hypothetical protein